MSDLSKIQVEQVDYNIKDAYARQHLMPEGFIENDKIDKDYIPTDIKLFAGSGSATNAATTNGNSKLVVADDGTVKSTISIVGTNGAEVTTDASGTITIDTSGASTAYVDGEDILHIDNGMVSIDSVVDSSSTNAV